MTVCLAFPVLPFSANSEWDACRWRVLPWCQTWGCLCVSSPEGPSSASRWCVATVVACTQGKISSPWSEPSPWKATVCGADAWSVCSLSAHLKKKETLHKPQHPNSLSSVLSHWKKICFLLIFSKNSTTLPFSFNFCFCIFKTSASNHLPQQEKQNLPV